MAQKLIGPNWNRTNRNNMSSNFDELYNKSREAKSYSDRLEKRVRDNERDITQLYSGTGQALEAANRARVQADNAEQQAAEAKVQGEYAHAQAEYAKGVADNISASTNLIHDTDNDTTYNWGLKVAGGHVVFFYEEAN